MSENKSNRIIGMVESRKPAKISIDSKPKSKYIASINGPFLFTAPHSGKLYRGIDELGEKKRVHLREKYTNSLTLKFALEVST